MPRYSSLTLTLVICFAIPATASAEGQSALSPPPPGTHFEFGGVVGDRIKANIENWLIPAPKANPGMTEMFQVRDRKPVPDLVPWAGEFVGKYLISAIQALRMSDSKELRTVVEDTLKRTIAGQDEDGYLGPFRKDERLLGHWDLWGHYHIILAMLMWHEETGDEAAFTCAKKMGDFICKVYLNTDKRPIDAGSTEMNLAVIHGLGKLYRATNDQKYLDLMHVIEEDWKKAGDYFRQGLAGVPFYKIPSPRWESLHDLQGLGELYRITGNEDYKTAYVNLWKSIQKYDRHNTGGFSTGEQAIGNPYTPGAIETCCTTAWSAITKDIFELTGDPEAADELELSFYNSVLGSQHPTGRWFTYNTPMDGKREASAHSIVFQSRAGTPELNCCSVNGPRGLGMLSEWAVMIRQDNELLVNYLGPMSATIPMPNGNVVHIAIESKYPADPHLRIVAEETQSESVSIKIRIPDWDLGVHSIPRSKETLLLELKPDKKNAVLEEDIYLPFHFLWGDGPQLGKVSLYRGPLLLAFDQHLNPMDVADIPALDIKSGSTGILDLDALTNCLYRRQITASDGTKITLQDFASVGATGTEYVSWLPAINVPPPNFELVWPGVGGRIPQGTVRFSWQGYIRPEGWAYILEIADDIAFRHVLFSGEPTRQPWQVVRPELTPGQEYYWRVRATNSVGETTSSLRTDLFHIPDGETLESISRKHRNDEVAERIRAVAPKPEHFTVDTSLKNDFTDNPATYEFRADDLIVGDYLDGKAAPVYGHVDLAEGLSPTPDRSGKADSAVAFDGTGQVRYRTPGFPTDNYALSVWFRHDAIQPHLAQVFSAWSKGGDDPLRIAIEEDKVYARIEGGPGASTKGAPVELGKWHHVAASKSGNTLRFFVDGILIDTTSAPAVVPTRTIDVSLGSNPHHTGDEHFLGAIDDFALYARPLSDNELSALASGTPKLEQATPSN